MDAFGVHASSALRHAAKNSCFLQGSVRAMSSTTIGKLLASRAARYPHRDAFRSPTQDLRWTWSEANRYVTDLGAGLHGGRMFPGKTLVCSNPSDFENMVLHMAAARGGFTLVSVDFGVNAEKMGNVMDAVNARAFVCPRKIRGHSSTDVMKELIPELLTYQQMTLLRSARFPNLKLHIQCGYDLMHGFFGFRQMFTKDQKPNPMVETEASLTPDHEHLIQYNNDTPYVFSHKALLANSSEFGSALNISSSDRVCCTLPLASAVGKVTTQLLALTQNAFVVLHGPLFDAKAALKDACTEHCNVLILSAANVKDILSVNETLDYSKLERIIIVANEGESVSSDALSSLKAKFTLKEVHVGQSVEQAAGVSLLSNDGTTFKPLNGVEVKTSSSGHLEISGPHTSSRTLDAELGDWVTTSLTGKVSKNGIVLQ